MSQTFPAVLKIASSYVFSVRPFDTITHFDCVSNGTVIIHGLLPGFSLSRSKLCFSVSVVDPFYKALEHMIGHNCSVNSRVQSRVNGHRLRCQADCQVISIGGCSGICCFSSSTAVCCRCVVSGAAASAGCYRYCHNRSQCQCQKLFRIFHNTILLYILRVKNTHVSKELTF